MSGKNIVYKIAYLNLIFSRLYVFILLILMNFILFTVTIIVKVTIQDCIFNNYVDYTSASLHIGNGQSVDTSTTFIIGTAAEFGATITGTAVTASTAKTGYSQSGYYQ